MSTFRRYTLRCACQGAFQADLAVAVNPVRMPKLRQAIVDGQLHRVTCPHCGREFTAEKRFVYADLQTGLIVHVHPPGRAPAWRAESRALGQDLAQLDSHGVIPAEVQSRLAFGIGELREKLVAQDHGLDDRHVELTKVLALHEHPVLLRTPRLRLFLAAAHEDRLEYAAGYDHADQAFRVSVPRFAYDRVAEPGVGEAWVDAAGHTTNLFQTAWVSVRQWATSNTALATLADDARTVRSGGDVDLDAAAFGQMLDGLPRGSQLSNSAKVDLRDLEKYARRVGNARAQDALFEVRFGIELEDDWGKGKDNSSIDTLWDLLKDLPDTNVEGNTYLREIILKSGDGGGVYNPSSDDIQVTTDPETDKFKTVMRHEVGHAVQEKWDREQNNAVTDLLANTYGWRTFPATPAGANAWVEAMGGWTGVPAAADRARVCDYLIGSLGAGSSWTPPAPVSPPTDDIWWRANFAPRLAVQGTLANWYATNTQWYRANGKAFFLNYWYRIFMAVDETSLDFVNHQMPWVYAAMSPAEFFAELYALFYSPTDPRRAAIAPSVADWFTNALGAPEAGAPAAP